jgi:hypothetical protein
MRVKESEGGQVCVCGGGVKESEGGQVCVCGGGVKESEGGQVCVCGGLFIPLFLEILNKSLNDYHVLELVFNLVCIELVGVLTHWHLYNAWRLQ